MLEHPSESRASGRADRGREGRIAIDAGVIKRAGFRFVAIPMRFSSGITVRRVSRIGEGEVLTLDVIVADGSLRGVLDAREAYAVDGGPLWVVSRDGLIAMKTLAGRPQDVADILRLQEQDG